jgi:hypothetical protein
MYSSNDKSFYINNSELRLNYNWNSSYLVLVSSSPIVSCSERPASQWPRGRHRSQQQNPQWVLWESSGHHGRLLHLKKEFREDQKTILCWEPEATDGYWKIGWTWHWTQHVELQTNNSLLIAAGEGITAYHTSCKNRVQITIWCYNFMRSRLIILVADEARGGVLRSHQVVLTLYNYFCNLPHSWT